MPGNGTPEPMEKLLVYHNPGCSKSRGAVDILQERDVDFEVVEYLKSPPDESTLQGFLDLLPDEPSELVRKDKHFKELGLNEADYQTRAQVVALLLEHPKLMQRPVVIRGRNAVIARPSDKVLELLD